MKVKDVIISALNILGRAELAALLSGGKALDGEQTETVNTLLYCFNAVEDELARRYFPLTEIEEIRSVDGEYYYATFINAPIKIKRVLVDGKEVEFKLFPQYMYVNSLKMTVEYNYAPFKKKLEGKSDFTNEVSEYLIVLGIAAEYCLINGEIEAADKWEKKYREEIDSLQSKYREETVVSQTKLPSGGYIPPRRWV